MKQHKIILAITGASGSIYASVFIDCLLQHASQIEECVVIFSKTGIEVWNYELGKTPDFQQHNMFRTTSNDNLFDPVASGSSGYDSMFIIPSSMGSMGRISQGISSNLIERAADVMLKERKHLFIVPREAPYNSIHLKSMMDVLQAGATIYPASPFFYHKPQTIQQLIQPFAERLLVKSGFHIPRHYQWEGSE
jgi:flavin prenyltransferase